MDNGPIFAYLCCSTLSVVRRTAVLYPKENMQGVTKERDALS